ncbi:hypothetical protein DL96DRAFT_1812781 [Flagelloscypha sp. PMI_526]|nr:hypothetical protein DL96DRAFT_1812781 [Flagelloscypha sp. PMI_526]
MPPLRSSGSAGGSAPVRKHHQKSRAGCRNCRGRRVKCDEIHPICKACHRRKEACVWDDREYSNPLEKILSREASAALADCQLDLPPLGEFGMMDLEVLHNWTTNTVQTFIPDIPHTRHCFQVIMPQLAFKHDFLFHAMFAMSSLHMHTLRPLDDYLRKAKMHCQRAILGLESTSDAVSWEVAFMANVLISMYWLASPSWKVDSQDGTPDLFDWFPVARTFMRRLSPYWNAVRRGIVPNSSILSNDLTTEPTPFLPSPIPSIVKKIHRADVCSFDLDELMDSKVVACYDRLVEKLTDIWDTLTHPTLQNLAIYRFPTAVREDFLELFVQKRPRALILVAHYCALLSQFGAVWWYGAERARSDIRRILSLLDAKWLPWMEYPLMAIKTAEPETEVGLAGLFSFTDECLGSESPGCSTSTSLTLEQSKISFPSSSFDESYRSTSSVLQSASTYPVSSSSQHYSSPCIFTHSNIQESFGIDSQDSMAVQALLSMEL